MSSDTTVKVYDSTHAGAPALSGTAGALIGVLDACLSTGYGSVTLDSIVVSSNVATCTKSAGHGLTALGATGPVIRIAGATPSGLNGDWRVTISSSTVFTFATSGIANQTATGTITATRAPLGFSKAFSGANLAAYRADDLASTRLHLRVDDTPAQYPALVGYETMSDINTGTGPFPSSGSFYFGKSSAASGTARAWRLVGDGRAFYLFSKADGTSWYGALFFGDILSFVAGDAYCCGLIGHSTANYTAPELRGLNNSTAGSVLARAATQTGGSIASGRYSHPKSGTTIGYTGANYPNSAGNLFLCAGVDVWENSAATCRGTMPGLYNPLHAYSSFTDGSVQESVPQLSGRTLFLQPLTTNAMCALDITGPWR